jgi:TolA-binding protein
MLGQWRTAQESQLAADPARADWVPMLQYEHGLALKESGKPAEARAVFDALAAKFTGRPEASNAVWRSAQCRREELASLLAAATAAKPQERPAAIDEAIRQVRQAADAMLSQAQELGRTAPKSEAYLRLLYDVTWCLRTVGMAEIEGSRVKLARQAAEQARQRLGGKGALPVFAPETIPLGQVPVQPAEQRAREQYQRLIDAAPQSALAQRARMELAEMVAMRLEQDKAADLLVAALEQDPPRELIEAIKLRLASICLARNDPKAALVLAQPIARDAAAPLAAEARFLTGESFLLLKEYARAIEQLVVFRDDAKLRELGAVADRALLRLGQAHGLLNQWEPSRQTLEVLLQRFPASEWADEARFGVGWAWENQKQHDHAVAAYAQVAGRSAGEVGARAQLHIGKCRMEQRRYADAVKALLAVPYTYDYGEWSAAAWCEAARAYVEMKQPGEAANACRRVLQQHPASRWAAVAREQLSQIK